MDLRNELAYVPRRTEFVRTIEANGWVLKLYFITAGGRSVADRVTESAVQFIRTEFDWPEHLRPGFGFVTIHCGEDAIWLLVDLWAQEILHHFVFACDFQEPTRFLPGPTDGTMACVWELEITRHERDAWVKHVLCHPQNPENKEYLNDVLRIAGD